MDNQTKQEFTRRISQSNRSQLTLVTYEICFAYLEEALCCLEQKDWEGYKENIRHGDQCIVRLQETLDFRYELAAQLYPLYAFCRSRLMGALYRHSPEEIEHAKKVLKQLYAAFTEAAKQDTSEPLMHNTQQVYAGMTYGKEQLNENYREPASRGFFA